MQLILLEETLQASIKTVSSLKNLRVQVNRLPASVLVEIFQNLKPDDATAFRYTVPPNKWIVLGHVCTHWRSLAYSTPSLWRSIHIRGNSKHVSTFLENSASEPLRIFFGARGKTTTDLSFLSNDFSSLRRAAKSIVDNMDRMEAVTFAHSFPLETVIQKDTFSTALTHLSAQRSRRAHATRDETLSYDQSSFCRLVTTVAPQMRELSLHGLLVLQLSASQVKYTTLTHLELHNQPWQDPDDPKSMDLDSFLDILEASSRSLQVLTLVDAGPQHQETSSNPRDVTNQRRIIPPPSLTSIELGRWPSSGQTAYFLAHLRIPGAANRCIWGENLKYLSSILFSLDTDSALTHERGWDSNINRVVITCAAGGDMVGIHERTVHIQGTGLDFQSIYPLFRDQPQIFHKVEELCLTPTSKEMIPTHDEYRALFETMPGIRRLIIRDIDMAVIFNALGLFSRIDDGSNKDIPLPLPAMKELDIQYADSFQILKQDAFGRRYITSGLSTLLGLTKLIQQRSILGRPIEKVRLNLGGRRDAGDMNTTESRLLERQLGQNLQHFALIRSGQLLAPREGEFVAGLLKGVWPSSGALAAS